MPVANFFCQYPCFFRKVLAYFVSYSLMKTQVFDPRCGGVAQLGERCVRNAEVGSSILLLSTTEFQRSRESFSRDLFSYHQFFRVVLGVLSVVFCIGLCVTIVFLPYFIGYQCFVLISVCRVVNAKGGRVKYICDVVKEFRRRGEEMAHCSGSIKLATSNSFSGLQSIFFFYCIDCFK